MHRVIVAAQAEAWYKRAHEGARSREHRARAAFMAAKSELARRLSDPPARPITRRTEDWKIDPNVTPG
jgi:hypothetical protein